MKMLFKTRLERTRIEAGNKSKQDIDSPQPVKFKNPKQCGMDSSCWKSYARQT